APHATHVPLSHVPPDEQTSFAQHGEPMLPHAWHMNRTQTVDVSVHTSPGGQHGMFASPHPAGLPPAPVPVPPTPPPKPPFGKPPMIGPASLPKTGAP